MKLKFSEQCDQLFENYGQIKEVRHKRFPRGLNGKLSEQFIKSLRLEFKRLTSPIIEEDEEGNEVKSKPDVKKVMVQLQKALPFLVR
jgi:hypothetical protein